MAVQRKMKAIVKKFGGKYQLEDVEILFPRHGEVLVKVEFTAQNPTDWKGLPMVPEDRILGFDFSGTTQSMGPSVDESLRYIHPRQVHREKIIYRISDTPGSRAAL
uniref:Alcohol dehydrogenase-like N-terminal domain-containing protein n=1 Tax=Moniliophthora roreri TaxID=221103 RepID=A0A0W0G453_MONRR